LVVSITWKLSPGEAKSSWPETLCTIRSGPLTPIGEVLARQLLRGLTSLPASPPGQAGPLAARPLRQRSQAPPASAAAFASNALAGSTRSRPPSMP
jgi:hypothetical protein